MKMKILTLYLLIGLILPAAQGSETVEPAAAEQHQNKSSFEFIEKMKDAMASTLEPGLVVCVGRHNKLAARNKQIDQVIKLFSDYLVQARMPCEGYDIILEDIRAHPDSDEVLRQLSEMDKLFSLVASRAPHPERLVKSLEQLDQRKQIALSVRRNIIEQFLTAAQIAKKENTDLLAQTKSIFETTTLMLRKHKGQEVASKWTLEPSLPPASTKSETQAAENILPTLMDAVKDYKELMETVKSEELAYLKTTSGLLSDNRKRAEGLLEEARLLQDPILREQSTEALEKDLESIDARISQVREKMKKLQ
jgi:hypothetical protein